MSAKECSYNHFYADNPNTEGGIFYIDVVKSYTLIIKECPFYNNTAQLNGGIVAFSSAIQESVNIQIFLSSFIENYAITGSGCIIYIPSTSLANATILLSINTFSNHSS